MLPFLMLAALLWACVVSPFTSTILLTTALIALVCLKVAVWLADGIET